MFRNNSTKPELSFILVGINPEKILEIYEKGFFFRSLETAKNEKQLFEKKSNKPNIKKLFNTTADDGIFTQNDHTNASFTIYCTNQKNYACFKETGELNKETNLRCVYCLQDIKDRDKAVHIPYKCEEKSLAYRDSNGIERIIPHYIFEVFEEATCDFREAVKWIQNKNLPAANIRDFNYNKSRLLLSKMFEICYPDNSLIDCLHWDRYKSSDSEEEQRNKTVNAKIIPSPDKGLLEENGGTLSRREFNDPKYTYIPLGCVIRLPVKKIYSKQFSNINDIMKK